MRIARKSIYRDFVDGGGLCSPGRWPKQRRNLPETNVAKALQTILITALMDAEKSLPGGSFKVVLHSIIVGNLECPPLSNELLHRVRTDLRPTLERFGLGDGLPQEGDRVQHFKVRLIQELLRAFGKPDACFCEIWARGVWLVS